MNSQVITVASYCGDENFDIKKISRQKFREAVSDIDILSFQNIDSKFSEFIGEGLFPENEIDYVYHHFCLKPRRYIGVVNGAKIFSEEDSRYYNTSTVACPFPTIPYHLKELIHYINCSYPHHSAYINVSLSLPGKGDVSVISLYMRPDTPSLILRQLRVFKDIARELSSTPAIFMGYFGKRDMKAFQEEMGEYGFSMVPFQQRDSILTTSSLDFQRIFISNAFTVQDKTNEEIFVGGQNRLIKVRLKKTN